jgi:hypothetical protein
MQIGQLKDSIFFPDEKSALRQKRTSLGLGVLGLLAVLFFLPGLGIVFRSGLGILLVGIMGIWIYLFHPKSEKRERAQAEAALVHLHSLVNNSEYRAFHVAVLEASWIQAAILKFWGKPVRSAVDKRGDRWTVFYPAKANEKFPARFYELHNNPFSRNQRYAVVPIEE